VVINQQRPHREATVRETDGDVGGWRSLFITGSILPLLLAATSATMSSGGTKMAGGIGRGR
jgi:hypothetical protein